MQIVAIRKTGDVGGEEQQVWVQQITVSGLNDAELSDAVDAAFNKWKEQGLNVQFRDDKVDEEVKVRILQGLFTEA